MRMGSSYSRRRSGRRSYKVELASGMAIRWTARGGVKIVCELGKNKQGFPEQQTLHAGSPGQVISKAFPVWESLTGSKPSNPVLSPAIAEIIVALAEPGDVVENMEAIITIAKSDCESELLEIAEGKSATCRLADGIDPQAFLDVADLVPRDKEKLSNADRSKRWREFFQAAESLGDCLIVTPRGADITGTPYEAAYKLLPEPTTESEPVEA